MFSPSLDRWGLTPDGAPILTPTSRLLPVRAGHVPAMLKIALADDEKRGGRLMHWWDGQGSAPVLAQAADALLLERAEDSVFLADFVRSGRDDEASLILCATVASLHAPRPQPPPDLVPLKRWFAPLRTAAQVHGGVLRVSAALADDLLAMPCDVRVLHGDIHHGNVLHFGARGWLAIDPKGLVGERAFDYANLFCNPDDETATAPGRLARRIEVVAAAAQLECGRLLAWIVAWAGLSAAFLLEDGLPPQKALKVASLAAELGQL